MVQGFNAPIALAMSTSPKASSSLNTAADPTTSSESPIELVQSTDPGSETMEGSDEHLRVRA